MYDFVAKFYPIQIHLFSYFWREDMIYIKHFLSLKAVLEPTLIRLL